MEMLLFKIFYWINVGLMGVIGLLYAHQIVYTLIGMFFKKKYLEASVNHKYAVLISARNEEMVIANLIDSLKKQNYPQNLISIFVVADNCTDKTASVAKEAGAIVYERFNTEKVGKGHALDHLINKVFMDYGNEDFEAFVFFDADNVAGRDFISQINNLYDSGIDVGMGYRSSKNFGDNWISMGHAVSFLRECRFMHGTRDVFGSDTYINGTGFYADCSIFKSEGGYKYYTMTEDVEFGLEQSLKGRRVGFNRDAIFYDEQPTRIKDSFNQRVRWIKGQMQCFKKYAGRLIKRLFTKGEFCGFDLMMHVFPGHVIAISWSVVYHSAILIIGLVALNTYPLLIYLALIMTALTIIFVIGATFMIGLLTVVVEGSRIKVSTGKKLKAIFTFPLFLFTYAPVVYHALFSKVTWKQIPHNVTVDIDKL